MLSEEDFFQRLALEAKMMEEEEPSFKPININRRRERK